MKALTGLALSAACAAACLALVPLAHLAYALLLPRDEARPPKPEAEPLLPFAWVN